MRRLLVCALVLCAAALAVGFGRSWAAQEGPTVPFQGNFPITVEAGEYDLVYLVLDFAPGAAIPLHYHGGPATVVGMEGELTLRPQGAPEKKLGPGELVQEKALAQHEMLNTGSANARILAVVLLPKGMDLTTVLAAGDTRPGPSVPFQGSYPISVERGEYDLVNLVLDFAPGAGIPLHYHGGPAVVVGMEGELTLRPEGAAEKKLAPNDVVQERMGARHEMLNTGSANARILAGVLLPKGAELTTLVGPAAHSPEHTTAPAGMPRTGLGNVEQVALVALILSVLLVAVGRASRAARRR
jgi:quercetin dioxygenase-like cupin family protein